MKKLLSTFLLLISYAGNIFSQTPPFENTSFGFPTSTNVTSPSPEAARLADLDHDGDSDVVIANGNFGSGFSVLLNNGHGSFSPAQQYTTGFESWDIVVADFTGDNIPDVIVSNTGVSHNSSGSSVSLFPGTGNGTFGSKTDYAVGSGPVGLTFADYNLDTFNDVAVANNGGSAGTTVSILLNNTTGGFLPAITIPAGTAPYKLQSAFVDRDSLPDIVVANEPEEITIMHNTGNGFTNISYSMQAVQYNNLWSDVQLVDVDNDNDIDVIYSSQGTTQLALRRNSGAGSLDSIEQITIDYIYGGAPSFKLADFNGDGFADLVAASATARTSDGFRVSMNQGNGTFSPDSLHSGGQFTFIVLTGDADLDSDMDILTVDNYSNELTVHMNDGSGNFKSPDLFINGLPIISTKIDVADFDNDGDLDILTSADGRTAINVPVRININNGNGLFTDSINITNTGVGGTGAKFRDINMDGLQDVIFASGINTTPYDYFTSINLGGGHFTTPTRWPVDACGWNDIDAADLDNDGDIDIILTEWLGCIGVNFSGQRIYINYNNGNGTFSSPVIKIVNPSPAAIAVCDFNEDGFLDLATGQRTAIDIALNDGAGDFLPPQTFPMSQSPFDIFASDLNNDGHSDIASCNYGSNPGDYNLTVRLGNGDGTFQNVQLLDGAYSPDLANVAGLAAADVDNDGDADIIVAENASNGMGVYLNDGNGIFSFGYRLAAYFGFRSPWFADFNGDGIKDLAGLVDVPPSGLQSALIVLNGINTGQAAGGQGLSECQNIPTTIVENHAEVNNNMLVVPNPFTSSTELIFSASLSGEINVCIYNFTGQIVFNAEYIIQKSAHRIGLSDLHLNPGIYHIAVSGSKIRTTTTVIAE